MLKNLFSQTSFSSYRLVVPFLQLFGQKVAKSCTTYHYKLGFVYLCERLSLYVVFSVDVFGEASHVPLVQTSYHRVTGCIGDVGHPGAAASKVVNVAVATAPAPAQFAALQLVDERFFTVDAFSVDLLFLLLAGLLVGL